MTLEDFFEKADYEGGLLEYLVGYGVNPDDIEDERLSELVRKFYKNWNRHIVDTVNAIDALDDSGLLR